MIPALADFTWWLRWMETRIITENGPYADSFVPTDYGGPQLTVKLVQRVLLCTRSCHFRMLTFGDNSTVQDNLNKVGMGIYILGFDPAGIAEEIVIGAGPSGEFVSWNVEENALLDPKLVTTLRASYPIAIQNLEL